MRTRAALIALLVSMLLRAVIIDRIAVVVGGDKIIKDSDIDRDIRLVSFINKQKVDFGADARRAAANRLVDQMLIRREIEVGMYSVPSESDVEKTLAGVEKSRCSTTVQCKKELASYGLTQEELKEYLSWQLTVLRFVDARFKPAAMVSDSEIENYYHQHLTELRKQNPGKPDTLEALHDQIQQTLTAEQVNQQFDAWLKGRRQAIKIEYREGGLA
jgi:peptidyl-prolyl cis-trans isomerase C